MIRRRGGHRKRLLRRLLLFHFLKTLHLATTTTTTTTTTRRRSVRRRMCASPSWTLRLAAFAASCRWYRRRGEATVKAGTRTWTRAAAACTRAPSSESRSRNRPWESSASHPPCRRVASYHRRKDVSALVLLVVPKTEHTTTTTTPRLSPRRVCSSTVRESLRRSSTSARPRAPTFPSPRSTSRRRATTRAAAKTASTSTCGLRPA